MVVNVNALTDAEFVVIQVPIPAGCTYAARKTGTWKVYRENYKDRVMLFAEFLTKGVHRYKIELEPRYKGPYTRNPAKVELMYYPVFFGINDMKRVELGN